MEEHNSVERIVAAAFSYFDRQGVRKTTLEDVAMKAGLTRITIYRHFGNKKELVRAVCMTIAKIFEREAAAGPAETTAELNARLNRLGTSLNNLPQGNALRWLEEVSRLYPDIYEDFRTTREAAINAIFQQALATARQEGTIRENLNTDVLKEIFWSSVMGLLENPTLISSHVPLAEIFSTVTEIFRYGILKRPEGRDDAS
jgi:AcrR family transcriptional regulator